ncbi:MAG: hypothetical protein R3D26_09710 [Cyanobacteriota/Melainabacteria group bacterium]
MSSPKVQIDLPVPPVSNKHHRHRPHPRFTLKSLLRGSQDSTDCTPEMGRRSHLLHITFSAISCSRRKLARDKRLAKQAEQRHKPAPLLPIVCE